MAASEGSDRRRELRAPIELRVEYKRVNTFFADYTKNISSGGTFIATEKPLDIGTEFVFALDLPGLTEPLRLRGRVMWTTKVEDSSKANPAGMGIEFQYSSSEERRENQEVRERTFAGEAGEQPPEKFFKKG